MRVHNNDGPRGISVFVVATCAILVAMTFTLIRAFLGPSVWDRILSVNNFSTKTVLLISVVGFLTERPDFLDIALAYALISFIATIAVLKFFEYGSLGRSRQASQESND